MLFETKNDVAQQRHEITHGVNNGVKIFHLDPFPRAVSRLSAASLLSHDLKQKPRLESKGIRNRRNARGKDGPWSWMGRATATVFQNCNPGSCDWVGGGWCWNEERGNFENGGFGFWRVRVCGRDGSCGRGKREKERERDCLNFVAEWARIPSRDPWLTCVTR
ncbi:hypothetical protein VNO78_30652 [Psophocarpus tetragonolobus]|uniref:Uncharacterized protein n=1 Tax=Psophocarpus tetragonolobus TaxID=3891 RepID=A0AAN9RX09_PSOTE